MKEINEMCEAFALFKAAVDALASKDADMLLSEKIVVVVVVVCFLFASKINN